MTGTPHHAVPQGLTRRAFLRATALTAGGVAFDFFLPALAESVGIPAAGIEIHSWVVIHPDDRVTVRIPQSEIGQGISTALAQVIGDELDLDLERVDWEFYDPQTNRLRNNVYVHTATLASWGAEKLFEPTRIAAAQIRAILLAAGAAHLKAEASSLTLAHHHVRVRDTDTTVGFGALAAAAAALPVPDAASVKLKPREQWRYIGQALPRRDTLAKVTGQASYGIDVTLPGMKYAAVRQAPVFGGRLRSFDAETIKDFPGVRKVVRILAGPSGYTVPPTLWDIIDWGMDDAVAVVADSWWQAQRALDALQIEWDDGKYATVGSGDIARALGAALEREGKIVRSEGDATAALTTAAKVVEAEYYYPFLEHAALEPMNCTALVSENSVEAWAPTQYGDEALRIAAYAAGVALKDARFHLTLAGGGFGRRLHNDYVSQAVQVAKEMPGTPIKLIWSREENTRRSYYPPVMTTRFRGGLDAVGLPVAWTSHVVQGRSVFQPYGASRFLFPVPHVEVRYSTIDTPPPFAWMRGVGHSQTAWMNHGFMCELAEAAGLTSLEMQRKLLDETRVSANEPDQADAISRVRRARRVLEEAVSRAGSPPVVGSGRGRGVAVFDLSYAPHYPSPCIAIALDVQLDGEGGIKVEKVTAAVDCGLALNPQIVQAQIQGGVIFGLSNALHGKITLANGRVEQSNFHDYAIMRMVEAPRIDVHLLPGKEHPLGVGEGAVPIVIGALVDAIYAAGGPRIRALPVMDADLHLRSGMARPAA